MALYSSDPFFIYQRARSPYWYVHFKEDGRRLSSGQTDREQTRDWAWCQIRGETELRNNPPSIKPFSESFFVYESCPIIRRLHRKGKRFSRSNARNRRGQLINHIWKQFGYRRIDSLEAAEIEDWLIEHKGSNHLKNQIPTTFNYVLSEARRQEIIDRAPTESLDRFSPQHAQWPAFSDAQVKKLFPEDIGEWRPISGKLVIAVGAYAMLYTGIRLGEFRALKWHRVHFANDILCVENSARVDNSIGSPKNGTTRWAPLSPQPKAKLLYLRNVQKRPEGAYVCSEDGSSPYYTNVC